MTVAVDFSPRKVGNGFRVAERRLKARIKPCVQASLRDTSPLGPNPLTIKVCGYHHSLALRGGFISSARDRLEALSYGMHPPS